MTCLCANAQRGQYISAIGTVTMATTASQLGHLTFLTDSSVLLFPPNKQGMPLAQAALPPPTPTPPPLHLTLHPLLPSSYSSFSFLSFSVNHKVLRPMGVYPHLHHFRHAVFPAKQRWSAGCKSEHRSNTSKRNASNDLNQCEDVIISQSVNVSFISF